jgi:hypothetical protein
LSEETGNWIRGAFPIHDFMSRFSSLTVTKSESKEMFLHYFTDLDEIACHKILFNDATTLRIRVIKYLCWCTKIDLFWCSHFTVLLPSLFVCK